MSDQRSAIAEFRELEQRRLAGGLTSAEVARFDWLRRVLGRDAASLTEEPAPAPAVRPQAWNPAAPGYEPDAPYDEAAWIAAGYDPSVTYDWSAYGAQAQGGQPGEVVTAPAIPIPSSLVPTAEPPAEGDLPSLDVLLTGEAPVAAAMSAVAAFPITDAFLAPDLGPAAVVPPAPPAPSQPAARLADEGGWPGYEPDPAAPPDAAAPAEAARPLDELAPHGPVADDEPPDSAPSGEVAAFDGLLSDEELLLLAGAGTPAEPAPGPTPVRPVVPEPPLAVPPDSQVVAAAEPLHPPLPEPVQANVFVPPARDVTTPAWVAFVQSLHPPLPGPAAASEPPPAGPPAEPGQVEDDIPFAEAILLDEAVSVEDGVPLDSASAPGAAPVSFGAYDEPAPASLRFPSGEPQLDPAIQPYEPAPPGTPRGEYDEQPIPAGRGLESMLPFDPAVVAAIPPGSVPEGYEPGAAEQPAISIELDLPGRPVPPATLGPVAELSEVSAEWQPEAALDRGFDLASEGSFSLPELDLGETPAWPPPGPPSPPPIALAAPASPAPSPPPVAAASPPPPPPSPEEEEVLEVLSEDDLAEEALPALELTPSLPTAARTAGLATPPAAGPARSPAGVFVAPAAGLFAGAAAHPPRPSSPVAAPRPPSVFVPPAADLFARPEPAAPRPATVPPPRPEIELDLQPAEPGPAAPVTPRPRATPPARPPQPAATATGIDLEPLPPLLPSPRLQGAHRVLVHTIDGEVKRGVLKDPALDAERLTLHSLGAGAPQVLATAAVKAVFFLLAPGERPPGPEGRKVRVTFRDGRQVFGVSPDYQEGQVGFMLIPVEAGTTTARIWIYQASVRQVVVS